MRTFQTLKVVNDSMAFSILPTLLVVVIEIVFFPGCEVEPQPEKSTDTMLEELEKLEKLTNVYHLDELFPGRLAKPQSVVQADGSIELSDLGLVLRKLTFDKPIDHRRTMFFSETEITNQMYASYLADTHQYRDDSELERAEREGNSRSTATPTIEISMPASLWRDGKIPAKLEAHPVSLLNTSQCVDFTAWLNARYDLRGFFRLPTDEEWLMAAYGTDREYPWGNEEKSWIAKSTEPVNAHPELRTPEDLYSMWGNVSELVLSDSDGYGGQTENKYEPYITMWLGTSFEDDLVRGQPAQPRQDYWGYTHSLNSRSDRWGFRIVFVPTD